MADRGDANGVRQALEHPDPWVRITAAGALPTVLAEGGLVRILGGLLEGSDRDLRYHAVVLLGRLGNPAAAPLLLPVLETDDEVVRSAAAVALGRIGLRSDGVVQALSDATGRDPSFAVRQSAVRSLGILRATMAFDYIAAAASDANPGVRHAAAVALGLLGDRRAIPSLRRLLDDPQPIVRTRAGQELARLDGPR